MSSRKWLQCGRRCWTSSRECLQRHVWSSTSSRKPLQCRRRSWMSYRNGCSAIEGPRHCLENGCSAFGGTRHSPEKPPNLVGGGRHRAATPRYCFGSARKSPEVADKQASGYASLHRGDASLTPRREVSALRQLGGTRNLWHERADGRSRLRIRDNPL
jgi:hypothetical protein